jgi:hypothetical protein
MSQKYIDAIDFIANEAPDVQLSATQVVSWAEPICELLTFIYDKDYDEVTEDLYEAIREAQDIEEDEEDDEEEEF